LDLKVAEIDKRLQEKSLLTQEMILHAKHADDCKARAGDTIDWSGVVPALNNIDLWEKVSDTGAK
jgi:hypothetical protein